MSSTASGLSSLASGEMVTWIGSWPPNMERTRFGRPHAEASSTSGIKIHGACEGKRGFMRSTPISIRCWVFRLRVCRLSVEVGANPAKFHADPASCRDEGAPRPLRGGAHPPKCASRRAEGGPHPLRGAAHPSKEALRQVEGGSRPLKGEAHPLGGKRRGTVPESGPRNCTAKLSWDHLLTFRTTRRILPPVRRRCLYRD